MEHKHLGAAALEHLLVADRSAEGGNPFPHLQ